MTERILSWTLAALFLAAGIPKLLGVAMVAEQFAKFGFPPAFRVLVGILEIAGAIGLLVPRIRTVAAVVLGASMIGAVATVVRAGMSVAPPLIVGTLLAVLALLARHEPAAEVRR